jgi:hypothetical protein
VSTSVFVFLELLEMQLQSKVELRIGPARPVPAFASNDLPAENPSLWRRATHAIVGMAEHATDERYYL